MKSFAFLVVNNNIELVTMWLSADETTILDNALITMEHLYENGRVNIHLRRLVRESSYFELNYSIDRIQAGMKKVKDENEQKQEGKKNDAIEAKRIQFQLSMLETDDHKRQLTFCNVDTQQNSDYKRALINGQLKLLQVTENIYRILTQLEESGHPDYQLRDEHYEIYLQHRK